jgi:transposase-like protein
MGYGPSLAVPGFITTSLDLLGSTVAEHVLQRRDGANAIVRVLLSSPGVRANPLVATVVERACRPLAPPRTVGELARDVGVAESTLRYHWVAALGRHLKPKTVLGISILLNALAAAEWESMTRVARDLGVHRRTLERHAIRLLDMPLTAAAAAPREVLVRMLLDRIVLPNLPTGSAAPIRRAKLR